MAYIFFNSNPEYVSNVDDCTINAICVALNMKWEDAYMDLCLTGLELHRMPSSKVVWHEYLKRHGFQKYVLPDICPSCYTVKSFTIDYPIGIYLLALENHVIAVVDGDYYDTVDTGSEVPIFYWKRRIS